MVEDGGDNDDDNGNAGSDLDLAATTAPNLSSLPPGAYQDLSGNWYDASGALLSWCPACNNGAGSWVATIGNVSANIQSGSFVISYTPTYLANTASYTNNLLINILCVVAKPGCRNVPVVFPTYHGSLHFAAGQNLKGLQNAIVDSVLSNMFSGAIYPGMPPGTQFELTYGGTIFVYTVAWPGTPASPGSIYISNYWMLLS